ncbi:hypothetical protein DY000_02021546 [Brassica cretica]|uniref:Uncharacterized protein n=1 Tax=Brassica cretica TaxID=69181 RepID=A0ABQ7E0K4_BRACR|nr:hypothetical protein DY000_02021546 [Brassica cretica]
MADDYFTKGLIDIYYPFNNRTSKLIDVDTKPSIDARLASFEDRLQSFDYKLDDAYYPLKDMKLLEDKLDKINFSQDLLREDFSQRLEDHDETTTARLGMHQHRINNLQNRMHVSEVDKEILKNQWTIGDEAIRSFIGT